MSRHPMLCDRAVPKSPAGALQRCHRGLDALNSSPGRWQHVPSACCYDLVPNTPCIRPSESWGGVHNSTTREGSNATSTWASSNAR